MKKETESEESKGSPNQQNKETSAQENDEADMLSNMSDWMTEYYGDTKLKARASNWIGNIEKVVKANGTAKAGKMAKDALEVLKSAIKDTEWDTRLDTKSDAKSDEEKEEKRNCNPDAG
jgi:hypothetical protein